MRVRAHTHTHTTVLWLDFVWDNPGEPVPEETFTHSHLSWSSIISYLLPPSITIHGILSVQFTCLIVFFHNLQVFFGLPPLHTPYISSPNYCHLFAAHAHTITTCFAVVPRLCHLILVCLSTLYLELSPVLNAILISAHWCATSFSFLMGQVLLPCNILLRTQLLYSLPLTVNDISLLVSNGTNMLWTNN